MRKVGEGCCGLIIVGLIVVVILVIVGAVTGGSESDTEGAASTPRPTIQPTPTPRAAVEAPTPASPLPSPTATATPIASPAARAAPKSTPTPTPRPTVTYATCDNVPTYLLRVDTQGRVAVQRDLVPSQPDGDNDGYACGDQLEHKRNLIDLARVAATPTAAPRPTPKPQVFQSCQEVPESLVVVDTQGRRAVPRHLVPTAPDGDNDGFACGGQLETPAKTLTLDLSSTPKPNAAATPIRRPTIPLDEIDRNCFHPWHGHHVTKVVGNRIQKSLGDIVKDMLNDPDSMNIRDVGRMRAGPDAYPDISNPIIVIMDFTARNAFGGTVRNTAWAVMNGETCRIVKLDVV